MEVDIAADLEVTAALSFDNDMSPYVSVLARTDDNAHIASRSRSGVDSTAGVQERTQRNQLDTLAFVLSIDTLQHLLAEERSTKNAPAAAADGSVLLATDSMTKPPFDGGSVRLPAGHAELDTAHDSDISEFKHLLTLASGLPWDSAASFEPSFRSLFLGEAAVRLAHGTGSTDAGTRPAPTAILPGLHRMHTTRNRTPLSLCDRYKKLDGKACFPELGMPVQPLVSAIDAVKVAYDAHVQAPMARVLAVCHMVERAQLIGAHTVQYANFSARALVLTSLFHALCECIDALLAATNDYTITPSVFKNSAVAQGDKDAWYNNKRAQIAVMVGLSRLVIQVYTCLSGHEYVLPADLQAGLCVRFDALRHIVPPSKRPAAYEAGTHPMDFIVQLLKILAPVCEARRVAENTAGVDRFASQVPGLQQTLSLANVLLELKQAHAAEQTSSTSNWIMRCSEACLLLLDVLARGACWDRLARHLLTNRQVWIGPLSPTILRMAGVQAHSSIALKLVTPLVAYRIVLEAYANGETPSEDYQYSKRLSTYRLKTAPAALDCMLQQKQLVSGEEDTTYRLRCVRDCLEHLHQRYETLPGQQEEGHDTTMHECVAHDLPVAEGEWSLSWPHHLPAPTMGPSGATVSSASLRLSHASVPRLDNFRTAKRLRVDGSRTSNVPVQTEGRTFQPIPAVVASIQTPAELSGSRCCWTASIRGAVGAPSFAGADAAILVMPGLAQTTQDTQGRVIGQAEKLVRNLQQAFTEESATSSIVTPSAHQQTPPVVAAAEAEVREVGVQGVQLAEGGSSEARARITAAAGSIRGQLESTMTSLHALEARHEASGSTSASTDVRSNQGGHPSVSMNNSAAPTGSWNSEAVNARINYVDLLAHAFPEAPETDAVRVGAGDAYPLTALGHWQTACQWQAGRTVTGSEMNDDSSRMHTIRAASVYTSEGELVCAASADSATGDASVTPPQLLLMPINWDRDIAGNAAQGHISMCSAAATMIVVLRNEKLPPSLPSRVLQLECHAAPRRPCAQLRSYSTMRAIRWLVAEASAQRMAARASLDAWASQIAEPSKEKGDSVARASAYLRPIAVDASRPEAQPPGYAGVVRAVASRIKPWRLSDAEKALLDELLFGASQAPTTASPVRASTVEQRLDSLSALARAAAPKLTRDIAVEEPLVDAAEHLMTCALVYPFDCSLSCLCGEDVQGSSDVVLEGEGSLALLAMTAARKIRKWLAAQREQREGEKQIIYRELSVSVILATALLLSVLAQCQGPTGHTQQPLVGEHPQAHAEGVRGEAGTGKQAAVTYASKDFATTVQEVLKVAALIARPSDPKQDSSSSFLAIERFQALRAIIRKHRVSVQQAEETATAAVQLFLSHLPATISTTPVSSECHRRQLRRWLSVGLRVQSLIAGAQGGSSALVATVHNERQDGKAAPGMVQAMKSAVSSLYSAALEDALAMSRLSVGSIGSALPTLDTPASGNILVADTEAVLRDIRGVTCSSEAVAELMAAGHAVSQPADVMGEGVKAACELGRMLGQLDTVDMQARFEAQETVHSAAQGSLLQVCEAIHVKPRDGDGSALALRPGKALFESFQWKPYASSTRDEARSRSRAARRSVLPSGSDGEGIGNYLDIALPVAARDRFQSLQVVVMYSLPRSEAKELLTKLRAQASDARKDVGSVAVVQRDPVFAPGGVQVTACMVDASEGASAHHRFGALSSPPNSHGSSHGVLPHGFPVVHAEGKVTYSWCTPLDGCSPSDCRSVSSPPAQGLSVPALQPLDVTLHTRRHEKGSEQGGKDGRGKERKGTKGLDIPGRFTGIDPPVSALAPATGMSPMRNQLVTFGPDQICPVSYTATVAAGGPWSLVKSAEMPPSLPVSFQFPVDRAALQVAVKQENGQDTVGASVPKTVVSACTESTPAGIAPTVATSTSPESSAEADADGHGQSTAAQPSSSPSPGLHVSSGGLRPDSPSSSDESVNDVPSLLHPNDFPEAERAEAVGRTMNAAGAAWAGSVTPRSAGAPVSIRSRVHASVPPHPDDQVSLPVREFTTPPPPPVRPRLEVAQAASSSSTTDAVKDAEEEVTINFMVAVTVLTREELIGYMGWHAQAPVARLRLTLCDWPVCKPTRVSARTRIHGVRVWLRPSVWPLYKQLQHPERLTWQAFLRAGVKAMQGLLTVGARFQDAHLHVLRWHAISDIVLCCDVKGSGPGVQVSAALQSAAVLLAEAAADCRCMTESAACAVQSCKHVYAHVLSFSASVSTKENARSRALAASAAAFVHQYLHCLSALAGWSDSEPAQEIDKAVAVGDTAAYTAARATVGYAGPMDARGMQALQATHAVVDVVLSAWARHSADATTPLIDALASLIRTLARKTLVHGSRAAVPGAATLQPPSMGKAMLDHLHHKLSECAQAVQRSVRMGRCSDGEEATAEVQSSTAMLQACLRLACFVQDPHMGCSTGFFRHAILHGHMPGVDPCTEHIGPSGLVETPVLVLTQMSPLCTDVRPLSGFTAATPEQGLQHMAWVLPLSSAVHRRPTLVPVSSLLLAPIIPTAATLPAPLLAQALSACLGLKSIPHETIGNSTLTVYAAIALCYAQSILLSSTKVAPDASLWLNSVMGRLTEPERVQLLLLDSFSSQGPTLCDANVRHYMSQLHSSLAVNVRDQGETMVASPAIPEAEGEAGTQGESSIQGSTAQPSASVLPDVQLVPPSVVMHQPSAVHRIEPDLITWSTTDTAAYTGPAHQFGWPIHAAPVPLPSLSAAAVSSLSHTLGNDYSLLSLSPLDDKHALVRAAATRAGAAATRMQALGQLAAMPAAVSVVAVSVDLDEPLSRGVMIPGNAREASVGALRGGGCASGVLRSQRRKVRTRNLLLHTMPLAGSQACSAAHWKTLDRMITAQEALAVAGVRAGSCNGQAAAVPSAGSPTAGQPDSAEGALSGYLVLAQYDTVLPARVLNATAQAGSSGHRVNGPTGDALQALLQAVRLDVAAVSDQGGAVLLSLPNAHSAVLARVCEHLSTSLPRDACHHVLVALSADSRLLRAACTDLSHWAQELGPGSRVDALLPLTNAWAKATVIQKAPEPFSNWYRVAFDGLGVMWRRWVTWEHTPGTLVWDGGTTVLPEGWVTAYTELKDGQPLPCDHSSEIIVAHHGVQAGWATVSTPASAPEGSSLTRARMVEVAGASHFPTADDMLADDEESLQRLQYGLCLAPLHASAGLAGESAGTHVQVDDEEDVEEEDKAVHTSSRLHTHVIQLATTLQQRPGQCVLIATSFGGLHRALAEWRADISVDERIDARDAHAKWYEGRVVEVTPIDIRVRYLGWCPANDPGRFDERINRTSGRYQPPFTKIRDWRRAQVGDEVELRDDKAVDNGTVVEVDQLKLRVKVSAAAGMLHGSDKSEGLQAPSAMTVGTGGASATGPGSVPNPHGQIARWYSLHDVHQLVCHATHRRPRAWADVDREPLVSPPVFSAGPPDATPAAPSMTTMVDPEDIIGIGQTASAGTGFSSFGHGAGAVPSPLHGASERASFSEAGAVEQGIPSWAEWYTPTPLFAGPALADVLRISSEARMVVAAPDVGPDQEVAMSPAVAVPPGETLTVVPGIPQKQPTSPPDSAKEGLSLLLSRANEALAACGLAVDGGAASGDDDWGNGEAKAVAQQWLMQWKERETLHGGHPFRGEFDSLAQPGHVGELVLALLRAGCTRPVASPLQPIISSPRLAPLRSTEPPLYTPIARPLPPAVALRASGSASQYVLPQSLLQLAGEPTVTMSVSAWIRAPAGVTHPAELSGTLLHQTPLAELPTPIPKGTLVSARYAFQRWYPGRVDGARSPTEAEATTAGTGNAAAGMPAQVDTADGARVDGVPAAARSVVSTLSQASDASRQVTSPAPTASTARPTSATPSITPAAGASSGHAATSVQAAPPARVPGPVLPSVNDRMLYSVSYEDGDRSFNIGRDRVRMRPNGRQALSVSVTPTGAIEACLTTYADPSDFPELPPQGGSGSSSRPEMSDELRESERRRQEIGRAILSSAPQAVVRATSSTALSLEGQWMHITVSIGAGLLSLHVNGACEARLPVEAMPRSGTVWVGGGLRVGVEPQHLVDARLPSAPATQGAQVEGQGHTVYDLAADYTSSPAQLSQAVSQLLKQARSLPELLLRPPKLTVCGLEVWDKWLSEDQARSIMFSSIDAPHASSLAQPPTVRGEIGKIAGWPSFLSMEHATSQPYVLEGFVPAPYIDRYALVRAVSASFPGRVGGGADSMYGSMSINAPMSSLFTRPNVHAVARDHAQRVYDTRGSFGAYPRVDRHPPSSHEMAYPYPRWEAELAEDVTASSRHRSSRAYAARDQEREHSAERMSSPPVPPMVRSGGSRRLITRSTGTRGTSTAATTEMDEEDVRRREFAELCRHSTNDVFLLGLGALPSRACILPGRRSENTLLRRDRWEDEVAVFTEGVTDSRAIGALETAACSLANEMAAFAADAASVDEATVLSSAPRHDASQFVDMAMREARRVLCTRLHTVFEHYSRFLSAARENFSYDRPLTPAGRAWCSTLVYISTVMASDIQRLIPSCTAFTRAMELYTQAQYRGYSPWSAQCVRPSNRRVTEGFLSLPGCLSELTDQAEPRVNIQVICETLVQHAYHAFQCRGSEYPVRHVLAADEAALLSPVPVDTWTIRSEPVPSPFSSTDSNSPGAGGSALPEAPSAIDEPTAATPLLRRHSSRRLSLPYDLMDHPGPGATHAPLGLGGFTGIDSDSHAQPSSTEGSRHGTPVRFHTMHDDDVVLLDDEQEDGEREADDEDNDDDADDDDEDEEIRQAFSRTQTRQQAIRAARRDMNRSLFGSAHPLSRGAPPVPQLTGTAQGGHDDADAQALPQQIQLRADLIPFFRPGGGTHGTSGRRSGRPETAHPRRRTSFQPVRPLDSQASPVLRGSDGSVQVAGTSGVRMTGIVRPEPSDSTSEGGQSSVAGSSYSIGPASPNFALGRASAPAADQAVGSNPAAAAQAPSPSLRPLRGLREELSSVLSLDQGGSSSVSAAAHATGLGMHGTHGMPGLELAGNSGAQAEHAPSMGSTTETTLQAMHDLASSQQGDRNVHGHTSSSSSSASSSSSEAGQLFRPSRFTAPSSTTGASSSATSSFVQQANGSVNSTALLQAPGQLEAEAGQAGSEPGTARTAVLHPSELPFTSAMTTGSSSEDPGLASAAGAAPGGAPTIGMHHVPSDGLFSVQSPMSLPQESPLPHSSFIDDDDDGEDIVPLVLISTAGAGHGSRIEVERETAASSMQNDSLASMPSSAPAVQHGASSTGGMDTASAAPAPTTGPLQPAATGRTSPRQPPSPGLPKAATSTDRQSGRDVHLQHLSDIRAGLPSLLTEAGKVRAQHKILSLLGSSDAEVSVMTASTRPEAPLALAQCTSSSSCPAVPFVMHGSRGLHSIPSGSDTGHGPSAAASIHPLTASEALNHLTCAGALVWLDMYNARLPAVILGPALQPLLSVNGLTGSPTAHAGAGRKFSARILPVAHAGHLGGTTVEVEVQNVLVARPAGSRAGLGSPSSRASVGRPTGPGTPVSQGRTPALVGTTPGRSRHSEGTRGPAAAQGMLAADMTTSGLASLSPTLLSAAVSVAAASLAGGAGGAACGMVPMLPANSLLRQALHLLQQAGNDADDLLSQSQAGMLASSVDGHGGGTLAAGQAQSTRHASQAAASPLLLSSPPGHPSPVRGQAMQGSASRQSTSRAAAGIASLSPAFLAITGEVPPALSLSAAAFSAEQNSPARPASSLVGRPGVSSSAAPPLRVLGTPPLAPSSARRPDMPAQSSSSAQGTPRTPQQSVAAPSTPARLSFPGGTHSALTRYVSVVQYSSELAEASSAAAAAAAALRASADGPGSPVPGLSSPLTSFSAPVPRSCPATSTPALSTVLEACSAVQAGLTAQLQQLVVEQEGKRDSGRGAPEAQAEEYISILELVPEQVVVSLMKQHLQVMPSESTANTLCDLTCSKHCQICDMLLASPHRSALVPMLVREAIGHLSVAAGAKSDNGGMQSVQPATTRNRTISLNIAMTALCAAVRITKGMVTDQATLASLLMPVLQLLTFVCGGLSGTQPAEPSCPGTVGARAATILRLATEALVVLGNLDTLTAYRPLVSPAKKAAGLDSLQRAEDYDEDEDPGAGEMVLQLLAPLHSKLNELAELVNVAVGTCSSRIVSAPEAQLTAMLSLASLQAPIPAPDVHARLAASSGQQAGLSIAGPAVHGTGQGTGHPLYSSASAAGGSSSTSPSSGSGTDSSPGLALARLLENTLLQEPLPIHTGIAMSPQQPDTAGGLRYTPYGVPTLPGLSSIAGSIMSTAPFPGVPNSWDNPTAMQARGNTLSCALVVPVLTLHAPLPVNATVELLRTRASSSSSVLAPAQHLQPICARLRLPAFCSAAADLLNVASSQGAISAKSPSLHSNGAAHRLRAFRSALLALLRQRTSSDSTTAAVQERLASARTLHAMDMALVRAFDDCLHTHMQKKAESRVKQLSGFSVPDDHDNMPMPPLRSLAGLAPSLPHMPQDIYGAEAETLLQQVEASMREAGTAVPQFTTQRHRIRQIQMFNTNNTNGQSTASPNRDPNPEGASHTRQPSSSTSDRQSPAWIVCPRCTLQNQPATLRCSVCDALLPSRSRSDADDHSYDDADASYATADVVSTMARMESARQRAVQWVQSLEQRQQQERSADMRALQRLEDALHEHQETLGLATRVQGPQPEEDLAQDMREVMQQIQAERSRSQALGGATGGVAALAAALSPSEESTSAAAHARSPQASLPATAQTRGIGGDWGQEENKKEAESADGATEKAIKIGTASSETLLKTLDSLLHAHAPWLKLEDLDSAVGAEAKKHLNDGLDLAGGTFRTVLQIWAPNAPAAGLNVDAMDDRALSHAARGALLHRLLLILRLNALLPLVWPLLTFTTGTTTPEGDMHGNELFEHLGSLLIRNRHLVLKSNKHSILQATVAQSVYLARPASRMLNAGAGTTPTLAAPTLTVSSTNAVHLWDEQDYAEIGLDKPPVGDGTAPSAERTGRVIDAPHLRDFSRSIFSALSMDPDLRRLQDTMCDSKVWSEMLHLASTVRSAPCTRVEGFPSRYTSSKVRPPAVSAAASPAMPAAPRLHTGTSLTSVLSARPSSISALPAEASYTERAANIERLLGMSEAMSAQGSAMAEGIQRQLEQDWSSELAAMQAAAAQAFNARSGTSAPPQPESAPNPIWPRPFETMGAAPARPWRSDSLPHTGSERSPTPGPAALAQMLGEQQHSTGTTGGGDIGGEVLMPAGVLLQRPPPDSRQGHNLLILPAAPQSPPDPPQGPSSTRSSPSTLRVSVVPPHYSSRRTDWSPRPRSQVHSEQPSGAGQPSRRRMLDVSAPEFVPLYVRGPVSSATARTASQARVPSMGMPAPLSPTPSRMAHTPGAMDRSRHTTRMMEYAGQAARPQWPVSGEAMAMQDFRAYARSSAAFAGATGLNASGSGVGMTLMHGRAPNLVLNRWTADASSTSRVPLFPQIVAQQVGVYNVGELRTSYRSRPLAVTFAGEGGTDAGGLFSDVLTAIGEEQVPAPGPSQESLPPTTAAARLLVLTPNGRGGTGTDQDSCIPDVTYTRPAALVEGTSVTQRLVLHHRWVQLGRFLAVAVRSRTPLPLTMPPIVWTLLSRCLHAIAGPDRGSGLLNTLTEPNAHRLLARIADGWVSTISDGRETVMGIAPTGTGIGIADLLGMDDSTEASLATLAAMVAHGDEESMAEHLHGLSMSVLSLDGSTVLHLVPHGRAVPVTPDSIHKYIQLCLAARVAELLPSVIALAIGITGLLPPSAMLLYSGRELEEAICGAPGINVAVLQSRTRYEGWMLRRDGQAAVPHPDPEQHPTVRAFWATLRSFTPAQQEGFLRFAYGRRRLPPSDSHWPHAFVLMRMGRNGNPDHSLPQAHTCYFQIDLPDYSSEAACRRALLTACESCLEYDLDGGAMGIGD